MGLSKRRVRLRNVYIHLSFWESAGKLPKEIYKRISKFLNQFIEDPKHPGINLHSISESTIDKRIHGARLTESYRIIVLVSKEEESYLLLYVDYHDDAYNWVKNKNFHFSKNNAFSISTIASTTTDLKSSESIFDRFTDKELFDAGINPEDIPALRRIKTREELIEFSKYFEETTKSILFYLLDGFSINDAIEKSFDEIPVSKTFQNSFENLDLMNSDKIIKINSEIDLDKIFSDSMENWRIFIHPSQKKIAERPIGGTFLINGSAGTGKTVVLLHRIKFILKNYPNHKILLLTFSSNLTLEIKDLLFKLIEDKISSVKITNLYEFVKEICKQTGWSGNLIQKEDKDFKICWELACKNFPLELSLTQEELLNEYIEVKELMGVYSREDYFTTVRKGKGKLLRKDRDLIWNIFEKFEYELKVRNYMTAEQLVHEAKNYLESKNKFPFNHILVDEVQDMTIEALRFLKSASGIEINSTNSLTLAGDSQQRIYRNHIPFSKAGLDIKGKSKKLKVNYRTSEQIRKYAQSILKSEELTEFTDDSMMIHGEYSTFTGPEPTIIKSFNEEDAYLKLKETLLSLKKEGVVENEICIIYRENDNPDFLSNFRKLGFSMFELTYQKSDKSEYTGFRVGTIRRVKGLEFRCIVLFLKSKSFVLENLSLMNMYERCELYVALSRARERVFIIE